MRPVHPRGFALLIVLWSVVLLALLATGIAAAGRSDAQLAANIRRAAAAQQAADGGVFAAVFHAEDAPARAWPVDGTRREERFGPYTLTLTVADESRKLNPNYTPPALLAAVLTASGADPTQAAAIAGAIGQWHAPGNRDATDILYRTAGLSAAPTGQPFRSVDELGLVLGMTPALLDRLRPHFSVYARGALDFAQADPVIRNAVLGLNGGQPPPAPGARPAVLEITADAQGGDGSRFVRHAVVETGADRTGRLFRVVQWDAPPPG